MGFCLLNNAAIAARYAQKGGVSEKSGEPWAFNKVLILDWDGMPSPLIFHLPDDFRLVHHGNGTQNIFYDDSTVMYMSVHKVSFLSPRSIFPKKFLPPLSASSFPE